MKIEVRYIGPEFAGPGKPDQCIQIGAVYVDLSSVLMNKGAEFDHRLLEYPMG